MDSYNKIKEVVLIMGKHNLEVDVDVDVDTYIIKDTYNLMYCT